MVPASQVHYVGRMQALQAVTTPHADLAARVSLLEEAPAQEPSVRFDDHVQPLPEPDGMANTSGEPAGPAQFDFGGTALDSAEAEALLDDRALAALQDTPNAAGSSPDWCALAPAVATVSVLARAMWHLGLPTRRLACTHNLRTHLDIGRS